MLSPYLSRYVALSMTEVRNKAKEILKEDRTRQNKKTRSDNKKRRDKDDKTRCDTRQGKTRTRSRPRRYERDKDWILLYTFEH